MKTITLAVVAPFWNLKRRQESGWGGEPCLVFLSWLEELLLEVIEGIQKGIPLQHQLLQLLVRVPQFSLISGKKDLWRSALTNPYRDEEWNSSKETGDNCRPWIEVESLVWSQIQDTRHTSTALYFYGASKKGVPKPKATFGNMLFQINYGFNCYPQLLLLQFLSKTHIKCKKSLLASKQYFF